MLTVKKSKAINFHTTSHESKGTLSDNFFIADDNEEEEVHDDDDDNDEYNNHAMNF